MTHTYPSITPEKLAIMKLNLQSHEHAREFVSEPTTPTGGRKFDFSNGNNESSSRSLARTSRQFSRSSRRSSSFVSSHQNKMSMELSNQAESKFFALLELMTSASREASSLKEIWAKIASERESFSRERSEMLEELTEVSQELAQKSTEQHRHGHEASARKQQVEKLLVELSAAVAAVTAEKKKATERGLELDRHRHELLEAREIITRTNGDYKKVRSELDLLEVTFRTAQADRDSARDEAEFSQRELGKVTRDRTEISSRLTDTTAKYDVSRKELLSVTDRLNMSEVERKEHLLEIDRVKEDAKKSRLRADEAARELIELTEKYERFQRDNHRLKEAVRTVESERDEYAHSLDHLRRELKTVSTGREEAEEKYSDILMRHEPIKRELHGVKERLRDIEFERNEAQETVDRSREQHRLVVIERDEFRDESGNANRRAEDNRRQIIALTDALRKSDQSLTDVRSELFTLTEYVKRVDVERDEARTANGRLRTELTELRERITVFEAEIRILTDSRDRTRNELEKKRREYEEITETITEYQDGSGELEFEIESLRAMLREAREQKERAIAARNSADRERDESISKYEAKCREMERFEETAAAHYHAHARGEGRISSSRVVSRSGTTINHSESLQE